jgi:uncharacterized protein (TIGR02118 family)
MEKLLLALWCSVEVDAPSCHARVLDEWAPVALTSTEVQALTVSVAESDQRIYTVAPDARGVVPNCDVLIALGLDKAHDLDDVPERDLLYAVAREVKIWRVDTRVPTQWERTWPDGDDAPGIKLVSFMRRADGMSHEQFVRHWTENHTPLAQRHHVGLWNYRQNVVRRAYTPGGADVDGIAELHFRTAEDFDTKFFDSDDGRAVIMADVKRFMQRPTRDAALMRERPLRTP